MLEESCVRESKGQLAALDARRVALGMTIDVVARLSGVSPSTVERVLSGRYRAASFDAVERIAAALGAQIRIEPLADVAAMRQAQAERKAQQIIAGGLPNAAEITESRLSSPLHADLQEALVQRTIHQLLAGSNRKLWAE